MRAAVSSIVIFSSGSDWGNTIDYIVLGLQGNTVVYFNTVDCSVFALYGNTDAYFVLFGSIIIVGCGNIGESSIIIDYDNLCLSG